MFKTQQECWEHVIKGESIFLKDTEIRFIDGVLKALIDGEWSFCPIAFENPKLFSC